MTNNNKTNKQNTKERKKNSKELGIVFTFVGCCSKLLHLHKKVEKKYHLTQKLKQQGTKVNNNGGGGGGV
jgi:predicted helicase